MNFLERLKIALDTFRRLGGIELPDDGRSSKESIGNAMRSFSSIFGSVSPVIDFEMLKTLKTLWLFNPDVSQYVANIVQLGNPGHHISVSARNDSVAESAVERLNEAASRIYRHGVGVDGLLNQYLTSIAWSGAISSEDVVNFAGKRIEKVVLVPVEQIRFRYREETDEYEPYQQVSGAITRSTDKGSFGLIPLNRETYRYIALSTVENSPYAKPPATAAVEPIINGQKPIMENIRYMAQKVGLMGLVAASVVQPPRKPNETEAEYQQRATAYLKAVKNALDGNFSKGLLVTFRDQKIEHTPVTTGAAGVYDLNRISEEQVFSGLHAMPGFHGRTDATTETFADVVYYLLAGQVENMQRPVARRQERTYMLDLRLAGVEVESVSVTFNKTRSRNAKAEAETEEIKQRSILERVKLGLITPDEAAQEMGYEAWASPELLFGGPERREDGRDSQKARLRLRFDQASQTYKVERDRYEIASTGESGTGNVFPLVKKKAQQRASN